ncbi:MAG: hypothetical protein ACERKZ_21715, partial [Lachnotalea sp.]
IDSYTVTSEITTPVDMIRKSNVSASAAISLQATASGWYQGRPTITFAGSDPNLNIRNIIVNSGVYNNSSASVVANEGENTYTYYATNVNNSNSEAQTLKLYADASAPTNVSIATISNWANYNIPLTIRGQDTRSGLASMTVQYSSNNSNWGTYGNVTYSGNTDLQTNSTIYATSNGYYRVIATDRVGYTTVSSSIYINNIDKSAPTLNYIIVGDLKNVGWYKGNAKLNLIAYDSGSSGIKSITVNGNEASGNARSVNVTNEGSNQYVCYATDNATNISSKRNITIKVDKTNPQNVSLNANTTNWVKDSLTLTIKGQDVYSGLNSFTLQYSSNGTNWGNYTKVSAKTYSNPTNVQIWNPSVLDNGYYRVVATDAVGYITVSNQIQVTNVDTDYPSITANVEGELKPSGWYKDSANLVLKATDQFSGVKSITVNGQEAAKNERNIEVEEGIHTFVYYATDNVGHDSYDSSKNEKPESITIKLDQTAPENVLLTPNTTNWTKDPVIITVKANDAQSGVATIELQYSENKKDWKEYKTVSFADNTKNASQNINVTDNGYYRIIVTDDVDYQTTSELLEVSNYDPIKPEENTIGIEANTIQWVDEPTGVELTGYGSDKLSGLDTVEIWERDDNGKFSNIEVKKYNGETSIESITYNTHENNYYKTKIVDQALNSIIMKDEEALEVDNVDPEAPNLEIESISTSEGYISANNGYLIKAIIEDNQSGYYKAMLQKLNEDGEWEDTNTEYKLIDSDTPTLEKEQKIQKEKREILILSKATGESVIGATTNKSILFANQPTLLSNKGSTDAEESSTHEVRKQGDNKVTIGFTVRENGTYRLKGVDLVKNTGYTNDTIEIKNLDGSMPVLRVEGNPEKWQNKDANITVIATDADTKIVKMTLDGEDKNIGINEDGEYYFTFDATKNQEFEVTAVDEAGNTTTQRIRVTKIDKESPVINTDIKKDWISNKYRNIKISGTDQLSGIQKVSVRYEDNEKTLKKYDYKDAKSRYKSNYKIYQKGEYTVSITDQAGNISTQTIAEANLDWSAPFLKVDDNPTIWQNTDATIRVSAIDEECAISSMTLDGKEQQFAINEKGEAYFTFIATKNQEYQAIAVDEAGNQTATMIKVTKIDKELPSLTALLDDRWNQDGYRIMNLSAQDKLSGIDSVVLGHEGVEEHILGFEYEKEQKTASCDYHITQNGDYILTIKDYAGNITVQTVNEAEAKKLKAIEVVVPPDKTKYYIEENFRKKGMVVDAIYNDNSRTKDINNYIILDGIELSLKQTKINLGYTENGVTVYTDTPIKVKVLKEPTTEDEPITPDEVTSEKVKIPEVKSLEAEIPEIELPKEEMSKVDNVVVVENKKIPVVAVQKEPNNVLDMRVIVAIVLLFLILFLLLGNVTVYAQDLNGEYKLLGKTRAVKIKRFYVVKVGKILRIRAKSNEYMFVFSKGFKKTHEECDVIVKIAQNDYEGSLQPNVDILYVQHKG